MLYTEIILFIYSNPLNPPTQEQNYENANNKCHDRSEMIIRFLDTKFSRFLLDPIKRPHSEFAVYRLRNSIMIIAITAQNQ